jgi:hypothetical protein
MCVDNHGADIFIYWFVVPLVLYQKQVTTNIGDLGKQIGLVVVKHQFKNCAK